MPLLVLLGVGLAVAALFVRASALVVPPHTRGRLVVAPAPVLGAPTTSETVSAYLQAAGLRVTALALLPSAFQVDFTYDGASPLDLARLQGLQVVSYQRGAP